MREHSLQTCLNVTVTNALTFPIILPYDHHEYPPFDYFHRRRLSCKKAYFEHVRSKYAYPGSET